MQGALTLWAFALLCTVVAGGITWLRHPAGNPVLPDIVHELVPQVVNVSLPGIPGVWAGAPWDTIDFVDGMIGLLGASVLFLVFTRRAPWLVLRRVLVVHSILLLLRVLTVAVTSLPDSRPKCHAVTPGLTPITSLTWPAVGTIALDNRKEAITCGDMVYSGHTAISTILGMTWHTYWKVKPGTYSVNFLKVLVWAAVALTVSLIVVARLHYTLDVLLGAYLAVTTWGAYHRVADDVLLGHRFYSVWLVDALVVYPFVEWMEAPHLGEVHSAMLSKLRALALAQRGEGAPALALPSTRRPGRVGTVGGAVDAAAEVLRRVHAVAEQELSGLDAEDLPEGTVLPELGTASMVAGDAAGMGLVARSTLTFSALAAVAPAGAADSPKAARARSRGKRSEVGPPSPPAVRRRRVAK